MATRNALSCSYIDVNNAVNGGGPFSPAVDGDKIIVPAGIESWTNRLVIPKGVEIVGQTKDFHIVGTLVVGVSVGASLSSFVGTQVLHVASTAGFNPNGGVLDVCSTTTTGQMTYESILGNTFVNVTNGAVGGVSATGVFDDDCFIGQGDCDDQTIILCDSLQGILAIQNKTGVCNFHGFTFRRSSLDIRNTGYWFTMGTSYTGKFRFHHNNIGQMTACLRGKYFGANSSPGVIDHIILRNATRDGTGGINQISDPVVTASVHDDTWAKPADLGNFYGRGGEAFTYWEDSYFWSKTDPDDARCVWDCSGPGHIAVRHNIVWNLSNFGHGTEGGIRCTRMIECYNNTIVMEVGAGLEYGTRAGTYLIANNRIYGPSNDISQLNKHPSAFRSLGCIYPSAGIRSGAFGWNPWDFNDTSDGVFTGCKRPDTTTPQPSTTLGVAGPSGILYNYHPRNGYYVEGVVTGAPTLASTNWPVLYDTSQAAVWKTDQWIGFQVTRVSNAVQPSPAPTLTTSVNLATLTGTQKITLSAGSGNRIYTINGVGYKQGITVGCLMVPGSPNRFILFQQIKNDDILGCWSPDSGTVAAGTVLESGDLYQGPIDISTPTTVRVRLDTGNGIGQTANGSTIFKNGDKYIIARTLSVMDSACRGESDSVFSSTYNGINVWVNDTQRDASGTPTAKWPRNKLEPYYNWNNIRVKNGAKLTMHDTVYYVFLLNRDLFNDNPNNNYSTFSWPGGQVTEGIGIGTLAQRPSGINYADILKPDHSGVTPNQPCVGYYATDTDTLYVLTGPSQWTPWWTPYQYPHPLASTAVPTITSAVSASFTQGVGGTFQATASGFTSSPTWSKTGTLPSGTTFSAGGLLTVGTGSAAGTYPIVITATNGSEIDSQNFTLTIAATPTRVIALSGSMAFGNVDINNISQKILTVTNNGNVLLTVTDITAPSGFTMDSTSFTVVPGASHPVTVSFSPIAPGSYSGTLTVVSDKTSGTNTTAISGFGATRIINLSGSLAFGNVTIGQTATRQLTVSNSGNVALTVTDVTYPEGFSGNYAGGSIVAGGSVLVDFTFAPTLAQVYSGTLVFATNKTSGTNNIAASGTGTVASTKIVQLSGSLAFGSVETGTTLTKVLTITNSGNSTLTVTNLTLPTGYSADWTAGTIASGAHRDVNITFAPVAVTTYNGAATVVSDATGGIDNTTVTGTGTAASTKIIGLSGNLAFGNVAINTSIARTLTITNSGTATLTVTSITYPTGYSGAYSGVIAAGASQDVVVTFAPTLVQSYPGTIIVNSDKTSGTNTITPSGAGVSFSTVVIGLTGSLVFGNVQKNHSVQKIMTIFNTGTANLVITNITCPTGFSVDTTSITVVPGGSQDVKVTFRPTANQIYSGVITITSNKTAGVDTMACSGTGTNKRQVPFFLIVR